MKRAALLVVSITLGWNGLIHAQRCDHCVNDGIDLSISLAAGDIRTPSFMVKHSEYYNIFIDAKWLLPDDELRCKMGFTLNPSVTDCKSSYILPLTWRVLDGDDVVAKGVDRVRNADFAASPRSLMKHIGLFRGKAKHRYVVELVIEKDASELNVTQPHLVVATPDSW
jgi:hypothetical protein